jgi:hypothetical protein
VRSYRKWGKLGENAWQTCLITAALPAVWDGSASTSCARQWTADHSLLEAALAVAVVSSNALSSFRTLLSSDRMRSSRSAGMTFPGTSWMSALDPAGRSRCYDLRQTET